MIMIKPTRKTQPDRTCASNLTTTYILKRREHIYIYTHIYIYYYRIVIRKLTTNTSHIASAQAYLQHII